uniref:UBIQUITIN_CONJUGAT_2 domain-containing protein n=1 Tax=Globodera pallida TaxID=36090 RepID=A0A183CQ93_GLOPA
MKRFPSAITSLRFLATKSMSAAPLMRQLAEIEANPPHGFSLQGIVDGNWRVVIFGPPNTLYEGGTFVAQLDFPRSYPQRPPKMRFLSHIFHPNIYADGGEVCVSILDDAEDGRPSEAFLRWQPVHTVESIVISVQSLLAEPNFRSPANYRASAMFHTNPEAYSDMVRRCVKESNRFFEQE